MIGVSFHIKISLSYKEYRMAITWSSVSADNRCNAISVVVENGDPYMGHLFEVED